jgi:Protein of unknown function (DUF5672)
MNNLRPIAHPRVAIVTPIHRFPLAPDEEISIRHLRHFLGDFPRYIIGPAQPPAEYSDFEFRAFPRRYFRSMHAYNLLMVSWRFFEAFADYDYILVYEPDCLVFSSDLESWCAKGWDYAGAPWFDDFLDDTTRGFWKVGNSGLSLRRVSAALGVLSKNPLEDPQIRLEKTPKFAQSPQLRKAYIALRTNLLPAGFRNSADWLLRKRLKDKPFRNDTFWALDARRIQPDFTIPTPMEAVGFSFEMAPRYCFEQNGQRLPFGCHAWAKYDRTFWEPYLLK